MDGVADVGARVHDAGGGPVNNGAPPPKKIELMPEPVADRTEEELLKILSFVSWNGGSWMEPGTHVYPARRGQSKILDRNTARVMFRGQRVQLASLLMLTYRRADMYESLVRMRSGCADRACVNPFHVNLGSHTDEKRRVRRLQHCALRRNSLLLNGCAFRTPLACGDETPSGHSSPVPSEFSALTSEVADSEFE